LCDKTNQTVSVRDALWGYFWGKQKVTKKQKPYSYRTCIIWVIARGNKKQQIKQNGKDLIPDQIKNNLSYSFSNFNQSKPNA
jgi:hypothetical protein